MKNRLCSLVGFLDVFNKNSGRRQKTAALPEGIYREFSLAEIKAATNNFHPDLKIGEGGFGHPDLKIGEGGFGPLYRGAVDDGTILVAVKILSINSRRGVEEFRTEVQLLCQLHHPNLVSLIGFCHEQNKIILVYEYMSRRSLDNHLFGGKDGVSLAWNHRLQICIGAARALHYLHAGAKRAVIHRDIKPSNILLDDEWSCKLSDFGLSKLGPLSMSKTLIRMESRIMGTIGYMAPEYALRGLLTEKSDVYSFGMVLFEVLCGRKNYDWTLPENQRNLVEWAHELGREGKIYDVVDPFLKGRIAPDCFKKCLEIARSCIHYDGNERPAMGEVEVALELALELQKKADSDRESIAPEGDQCTYEEASYCTYFDIYNDSFDNIECRYLSESASDIDSS